MFKHYLITAFRHFRRYKLTTSINAIGLLLGLTCFLGAHAIAQFLQSSDTHFEKSERTFALTQRYFPPGGNMAIPESPSTVFPLGEFLHADIPQLEAVSRLTTGSEVPVTAGAAKTFSHISYADSGFFDIFTWPFLYGDVGQALRNSNSVVLNERVARLLFGDPANAVGKELLLYGRQSLTVTGVYAALPGLSHLGAGGNVVNFEMIGSMDIFRESTFGRAMRTNWNSPVCLTYALLPKDGSFTIEQFRQRLRSFDDRHVPKHEWQAEFGVVPVAGVMVASINAMIGTDRTGASIVVVLYILGAIVLAVSALNYANLATAHATTRAKEIGLRRVVGARRSEVGIQHIGEAILLTLPVAIVAYLITLTVTAAMNPADKAFVWRLAIAQLPVALIGASIVGCLAGAYPALILSRIKVADALRAGKVRAGPRFVASLLVGTQFAATAFLLIVILVMNNHHQSMKQAAYSKFGDPLVSITNNLRLSALNADTLRTELLKQPHIKSVTTAMMPPWTIAGSVLPVSLTPEKSARQITVLNNHVGADFLKTMDVAVLTGRDFEKGRADDLTVFERGTLREGSPVIVDRAFVEQHGWSVQEALNKTVYAWMPGANATAPSLRIIGVVENKPLRLLGLGATSNLYMQRPDTAQIPIVRISGDDIEAGLREIDAVWEKLAPNIAIQHLFADEMLASSMKIFLQLAAVFQAIAVLALLIAMFGLIGMAVHVIGRRTHEIGVRKTLGASVRQVLFMLLKDFSKPVLIANVVAWPMAFLAAAAYLAIFVSRSSLSPAPFAISLLFTLVIAWLAVGLQALRAARLNPATVLRYE